MGRKSMVGIRREEIVDAVQRCIMTHGMADTTMAKVAEEAGMKRSAVSHFLGNREAVIAAAVERSCDYYINVIEAIEAAHEPQDAPGAGRRTDRRKAPRPRRHGALRRDPHPRTPRRDRPGPDPSGLRRLGGDPRQGSCGTTRGASTTTSQYDRGGSRCSSTTRSASGSSGSPATTKQAAQHASPPTHYSKASSAPEGHRPPPDLQSQAGPVGGSNQPLPEAKQATALTPLC